MATDPEADLRSRLHPLPVPGLEGLRLYTPHPGSGLARLSRGRAPYWAYAWPGGVALARHLAAAPGIVAGRRVVDLGAGSGLVGIAAALAGAAQVTCLDSDPVAGAAIRINAALNEVSPGVEIRDALDGPVPEADIVLAGDVFYDPVLAGRSLAWLDRCRAAGLDVLVGDIGRAPLPRDRLHPIASYQVRDVGDRADAALHPGRIYTLRPG